MTTVPGGETLESQRDRVIKFWSDWHWKLEEAKRLTVGPSIPSQVIYLQDLVEDSLGCTYDKTEEEERRNVQEILDSLPRVQGLRWILGNVPTVNRVLANHLRETGVYLLPAVFTLTTDTYEDLSVGLGRLLVGRFLSGRGVGVALLGPGGSRGIVGAFVLGVPE